MSNSRGKRQRNTLKYTTQTSWNVSQVHDAEAVAWQLDRQMLICLNSRILIMNSDWGVQGGLFHTRVHRGKLNMLFQAQPRNFRESSRQFSSSNGQMDKEERGENRAEEEQCGSSAVSPSTEQWYSTSREPAFPLHTASVLGSMSRARKHCQEPLRGTSPSLCQC